MPKVLSAKVGVPLQGNGKFDGGAYYVVGCLLKLIVLSSIINHYLVRSPNNLTISEDTTVASVLITAI